jgi:phage shock protein C
MKKVNLVSLGADARQYSLDDGAYAHLYDYLERARVRLHADPDRDEVLRDLEQSISEKFANLLREGERVLTRADVEAALAQVGPVDAGSADPPPSGPSLPPRRRRLYRLREGQRIAGVCAGLAAYSDIRVDWIRTLFLALAAVTGGLFIVIYFVAAFILPVAQEPEEYAAAYGSRFRVR